MKNSLEKYLRNLAPSHAQKIFFTKCIFVVDNGGNVTPKKRNFARFLAEGMSPEAAAISAGYAPTTASRRAKEMAEEEEVKAVVKRERERPTPRDFEDPADFMHWMMNNDEENMVLRFKAANSLMQNGKPIKKGKKEIQIEKARAVNKYQPMRPPPVKH